MKKYLALAAAGGALALGVPAAFAATDAPTTSSNTPVQSATPTPAAPDQGSQQRGDDCPFKDGGNGGGNGQSAPSTAPDNSGTSL